MGMGGGGFGAEILMGGGGGSGGTVSDDGGSGGGSLFMSVNHLHLTVSAQILTDGKKMQPATVVAAAAGVASMLAVTLWMLQRLADHTVYL